MCFHLHIMVFSPTHHLYIMRVWIYIVNLRPGCNKGLCYVIFSYINVPAVIDHNHTVSSCIAILRGGSHMMSALLVPFPHRDNNDPSDDPFETLLIFQLCFCQCCVKCTWEILHLQPAPSRFLERLQGGLPRHILPGHPA